MILAKLISKPAVGYGKVGRILVAIITVAAIIALSVFVPGSQFAIGVAGSLGITATQAAFLIIAVGSTLISLAGTLISSVLFRPKSPMSEAKVNLRLEQSHRWVNGGRVLQGGTVVFAEYDSQGNFWIVLIHCDSELVGSPTYVLDNQQVTVNGSGDVISPDFTFKGQSYFRVWTHTHTPSNPVPPGSTALAAAFPYLWNLSEHLLAGTTYTVMRCRPIKIEDRQKIYRWRGPIGLGEPNLAVLGSWSRMYDPRDETQTLGDRSTYKASSNSAIVWAWWRTHPLGMNKPESSVNWERVAEQADICDELVVGIESTQPRYECAIGARDDVARGDIQTMIALSCDGQIVFDDDGKSWMRVGHYETPTLSLSRNRDIITMSSVEAQDGESESQGVVVRYIEPTANYTLQAAAAWRNPNYYEEGKGNRFLTVDVQTCSNHNQAMRLAKAFGMRSQPMQKLAPTTGLRGLRAMQERIVNINYDNTFAGDYEIVSPVEIDESGMFCSLGLVPVDEDRWNLLPGEERTRPGGNTSEVPFVIDEVTGVSISYTNGRIEVTFDPPVSPDIRYEFQYIVTADISTDRWLRMVVDMDAAFAYSDTLPGGVEYSVRWRSVSVSTEGEWTVASITVTTPEPEIPGDGDIIDGQIEL